jgi:hypothetical protein
LLTFKLTRGKIKLDIASEISFHLVVWLYCYQRIVQPLGTFQCGGNVEVVMTLYCLAFRRPSKIKLASELLAAVARPE